MPVRFFLDATSFIREKSPKKQKIEYQIWLFRGSPMILTHNSRNYMVHGKRGIRTPGTEKR